MDILPHVGIAMSSLLVIQCSWRGVKVNCAPSDRMLSPAQKQTNNHLPYRNKYESPLSTLESSQFK